MALPVSADEIASMRATAELTLTGSAALVRRTAPLANGRGGVADTVETVDTVSCLLQPVAVNAQGEASSEGDREDAKSRWRVLMPYGTGAVPGDELHINGQVYVLIESNAERGIPIYDDVLAIRDR